MKKLVNIILFLFAITDMSPSQVFALLMMRGDENVSINRRCPFCNGNIFHLKSERVGFVTQKTLGGSVRQYFHMECFKKAGRGKS